MKNQLKKKLKPDNEFVVYGRIDGHTYGLQGDFDKSITKAAKLALFDDMVKKVRSQIEEQLGDD